MVYIIYFNILWMVCSFNFIVIITISKTIYGHKNNNNKYIELIKNDNIKLKNELYKQKNEIINIKKEINEIKK